MGDRRSTPSRKEKEVWAACDKLKKQGKKLTYRAIGDTLMAMGLCRGSQSDLYRYFSSWKAQSEKKRKSPLSPPAQDLIQLFDYHQQQCDRYLSLLSNLRESNYLLLREMTQLHRLLSKKDAEIQQPRHSLSTSIQFDRQV